MNCRVLMTSLFATTFVAFTTVSLATSPGSSPQNTDTVTVDRQTPEESDAIPRIGLSPVFTNLDFHRPVDLTDAVDGTDRIFVVEQRGEIVVFENRSDVEEKHTFLNIRDRVFMGHNEEGLLALRFHPNYEDNGYFYVWYSAGDRDARRTLLSRFSVSDDDPNRADEDSELVILEVDQPWGNHNGGTILFGPDGYLYLSIGDGGWANDPRNYSQNNESLLGTVIRIDIDNTSGDKNYAIPPDNPFVNDEEARDEIWAYGLRNIWRMSFDRETGDLWAGDVGQNAWEAVYILATPGGNYGWNIREGSQPFRPREVDVTLIDPVIEYSHRHGKSITGGFVYRGEAYPDLQGVYLYADYVSGRFWGIRYEGGEVTAYRTVYEPDRGRPHVTTFGEDEAGELYVCIFERMDRHPGRIYRIRGN